MHASCRALSAASWLLGLQLASAATGPADNGRAVRPPMGVCVRADNSYFDAHTVTAHTRVVCLS